MELNDVIVAGFAARSTARFPLIGSAAAASRPDSLVPAASAYRPGVCNIGPAEIARRRRSGVIATIATLVLLAILVAVDAAPALRAIVFVPAAVATAGFLQASLKFCAGFGWMGIFNFDDVGSTEAVAANDARRRDRLTAVRIGVASAVVGVIVALLAVALPV